MALIAELSRRRVFHVVILYAAVAWGLTEGLSYFIGVFNLPGWSNRFIAYAFLLGFPVAAVLAWKYDIRTGGTEPLPPIRPVLLSIAAVLLFSGGLVYVLPGHRAPPAFDPPPNAIAVLPFSNRSQDAADEYFGEALTDELINAFSRVPNLLISGRTSVDAVVNSGLDLKQIGRRLNVSRLLEGSVRVEHERVQISVQLIDATSGFELWSQVYDQPLTDLARVQQEIGRAIAQSTAPNLIAKSDIGRVFKAAGCDAIYPMYMRASYLRQRDSKKTLEQRMAGYQRAVDLMREATEISPGCALAWEGLALSYARMCYCIDRAAQEKLYARIVPLVRKAIELNPDLPRPWVQLGLYAEFQRRWIDSEEYMLNAYARAPNDAGIVRSYAEDLWGRGRIHKALEVMLHAYQLNPVSAPINGWISKVALTDNQPELAIKHSRIARELEGKKTIEWLSTASGYLMLGQVDKALALYRPHFYEGRKKLAVKDYADLGEYDKFVPSWYESCIRAHNEPGQVAVARAAYRQAYTRLDDPAGFHRAATFETWWIKTCALWLGDADWLAPKMIGDPPYEFTNEDNLFIFWIKDSKWLKAGAGEAMRANPQFHRFARDVGLIEYWRHFGWPDSCQPDGDDFVCDQDEWQATRSLADPQMP